MSSGNRVCFSSRGKECEVFSSDQDVLMLGIGEAAWSLLECGVSVTSVCLLRAYSLPVVLRLRNACAVT